MPLTLFDTFISESNSVSVKKLLKFSPNWISHHKHALQGILNLRVVLKRLHLVHFYMIASVDNAQ